MKDIENEIAQVYAKGVLDFLDDCVWHKTIANWNMSNNSGTYRIYDNEDKEIYPQYDKENPSQYRKKRTEEDRLKSGMYIGDLMIKDYYKSCQNDPNLRWNKGTLTIYPNGAYESSFIWDNEAHLNYLLNNIYARKQIFVENIFTSFDFEEEGFDSQFGYISVVIDIKKRQEILTERKITTTNGEIKEIGLDLPKHHIEAILDFQLQTNELELGERAIKWNRATFSIPADIYSFDPDKDVSFEWLPENEV